MKIAKIELCEANTDAFIDIEVDDVHEYLLEDGTVSHNSSKVSGLPNGIYPVRELYLLKSDGTLAADFIAKDSDTIGGQYQLAWELSPKSLFHYYGVIQKFTDQASSADVYSDRRTSPSLPASRLLDEFFYQYKYGVKSRYYTNSKTTKGLQLESVGGAGCSGGGCTL